MLDQATRDILRAEAATPTGPRDEDWLRVRCDQVLALLDAADRVGVLEALLREAAIFLDRDGRDGVVERINRALEPEAAP